MTSETGDARDRRGYRWERCPECLLPVPACICEFRPTLEANARFLVLMHPDEARKPTNTGRLIADCFASTSIVSWDRNEIPDAWREIERDDSLRPYVVFPDDRPDRSGRVVEVGCVPGVTPVFIIVDGTWRQARKILRKTDYLADLPIVALDPRTKSDYGLRRVAHSEQLCTAEVAVALLELVGESRAASLFDSYFKLFNLQYRLARKGPGNLKAEVPERDELRRRLAEARA